MKIVTLYSLFFILSTLLIVLTLTEYMQGFLLSENKKEIRVQKSKKNYLKRREEFVPIRTLAFAQKAIDAKLSIFDNNSIELEQNIKHIIKQGNDDFSFARFGCKDSSSKELYNKENVNSIKVTLSNLIRVLNHLDEEAILTISTYSNQNGSKAYNLELSQKYADILKKYFRKRTSLPLIVAIGYGKLIPSKKEDNITHRQVEINLKRIK